MNRKTIRIFISSPHDVQSERNIAKNTLREIGELYSNYVNLEVVMWEDLPLQSDSTFQEGIDYFLKEKPIDIAVFILWSRLGTPLCTKFRKPDGTMYESGTEYEFDLMMQLHNKSYNGLPRILTYLKDSQIAPTVSNTDDLKEYIRQKELLDSFVKEHFRDDESNSNYAYMQFGENASFEQKFETHIKTTIKSMVGEVKDLKEWEGNPYVGLNAFDYEHRSIFFGRRKLIYETASKLVDISQTENRRSLIVLGESGSGKSSFVQAGLIPFFCNEKGNGCEYVSVTPSQFSGKMYDGLLNELRSFYPFLNGNPFIEEISEGMKPQDNFGHLRYALDNHKHKGLILYADQFEELFDENQYTDEERKKAVHLLLGIVSTGRIHVFISMRSDFYYWFSREPELHSLKSACLNVDIPAIDESEITEIVVEPARKAALSWEIDDNGEALNKRIVTDALRIKELPLIEFALSELYKLRDGNDCLTFDAYDRIGKLEGAVINYADRFYGNLSEDEKSAFSDLLGYVIAESSSNKGSYIRKTSQRTDAETNAVTTGLIDKLISSHLFVSGKDSQGNATISIVHEMLIRSWSVISKWVDSEKDFLNRNGYYERLTQYWMESGKSRRKLISGRSPILEAEYHLYKNNNRLSQDVKNFLELSIRKEKRKGLGWRIGTLAITILITLSMMIMKMTGLWEIIDPDIMEWSGLENFNIVDIITIYGAIILVLSHSICVRIKGQPEYRTIRNSLMVWISAFLLFVIDLVCTVVLTEDFWNTLLGMSLLFIPVVIVLGSMAFEYFRRRKWMSRYVPYRWSDDTMFKFRTYSVFTLILLYIIMLSFIYYASNDDKEEKMKQRAETADMLFDGLEKTKNTLTRADLITINLQRKEYLETNFRDSLEDTICDHRELEYALCLLNLAKPYSSLQHLYPDNRWDHHLLWIICNCHAGVYDKIGHDIELYLEGNRYDEVGFHSTADLIWPAEKVGRFDLAERLYDIINDTLPERLNSPTFLVNRGHIFLSKEEMGKAISLYKKAMENSPHYGIIPEAIIESIRNDFHIFSRESVIADKVLADACRRIGTSYQPTYVSKATPLLNEEYWPMMDGTWRWNGPEFVVDMIFGVKIPNMTYSVYDSSGTNVARFVSNVRIAKGKNGDILWDELNLYEDTHALGKILSLEADTLRLQVVDNGIPQEKGQIRTFIKLKKE